MSDSGIFAVVGEQDLHPRTLEMISLTPDPNIKGLPNEQPDLAHGGPADFESIVATGEFADYQRVRAEYNAHLMFAQQPAAGGRIAQFLTWLLNKGLDALAAQVQTLANQVSSLYRVLYRKFKQWFPILAVPGKALKDSEWWLYLRTQMLEFRATVDVNTINLPLKEAGGIGWQGAAAAKYFEALPHQFNAANTVAQKMQSAASGIQGYANGVARIAGSFANELYAVTIKFFEMFEKLGVGILKLRKAIIDPKKIPDATVDFIVEILNAIAAFVKQLAAMGMYFGTQVLSAKIPLDFAVTTLRTATKDKSYLPRGRWPDPTRYVGFPTVGADGRLEKYHQPLP